MTGSCSSLLSSFLSQNMWRCPVRSGDSLPVTSSLHCPPGSSKRLRREKKSCCLSLVTCCRVCNASMGPLSWRDVPDTPPLLPSHTVCPGVETVNSFPECLRYFRHVPCLPSRKASHPWAGLASDFILTRTCTPGTLLSGRDWTDGTFQSKQKIPCENDGLTSAPPTPWATSTTSALTVGPLFFLFW